MKVQEILVSAKNQELLVNAVYSMMGVTLSNDELLSTRYSEIISDLKSILHDVNTDFINMLTLIKSRNDDLKTINRQIALRVFESFEHRAEKAFLEERRREAAEEAKERNLTNFKSETPVVSERRNEVILFGNDTKQTNVIDSFYVRVPSNTEGVTEDFFGNVRMTPRLAFDDMKLTMK